MWCEKVLNTSLCNSIEKRVDRAHNQADNTDYRHTGYNPLDSCFDGYVALSVALQQLVLSTQHNEWSFVEVNPVCSWHELLQLQREQEG